MTKPNRWNPGDKITADRLNADQAEAVRQRGSVNFGSGSSLVHELMGNQSAHMQRSGLRLAFATEDFAVPTAAGTTDLRYQIVDPVPSGKCKTIRLNTDNGEYEEETENHEFRVHDVLAHLSNSTPKGIGESFYVGFNKDSNRWEVIGGGGNAVDDCPCSCIENGDITVDGIESTSEWSVTLPDIIEYQANGSITLPGAVFILEWVEADQHWVLDIGSLLTAAYSSGNDATADTTMDGTLTFVKDDAGKTVLELCFTGTVPVE